MESGVSEVARQICVGFRLHRVPRYLNKLLLQIKAAAFITWLRTPRSHSYRSRGNNHLDQMSNCEQTRATLHGKVKTVEPVLSGFAEALHEYVSHIVS